MSLRTAGSLLLISCYELGHQPHGIVLPCAFLKRAGYDPDTLDLSVEAFDKERVRRARFIGLSVPMHTALRLGARVIERVRSVNTGAHICGFGLYAFMNAEYLLQHGVDSVIGGEIEGPLVALVESLDRGDGDRIEGVVRPGEDGKSHLKRLSFPVPYRKNLPQLSSYAQLEWKGRRVPVGYVEASRGCLHHCLHCPIPPVYGGRFFVVSRDVVLEDIRGLVRSGARHITFGDPDFLNGPTHALKIVRAVHEEFPKITFDFTAKVEHLLRYMSLLPELGRLGCIFVVSAAESTSDIVLAHLHKGHTRADLYQALSVVRNAGISFRPSWVPFTPWTTLDDYIDMLDFVKSENLVDNVDSVQYAIRLLVPPGSSLLSQRAMQPYLKELDPSAFIYRWIHPDSRMEALYEEVKSIVEACATDHNDTLVTFKRIYEVTCALRGEQMPAAPAFSHDRMKPPRLTEPWFCCAEPTESQLKNVLDQEGECECGHDALELAAEGNHGK